MKFKKLSLILFWFAICSISCDSYLLTPFTNVCDGIGIEYAKEYNPNEKTHKIIFYEKGENLRDDWNSKLPPGCLGTYTDCDLVGCIEKDHEIMETCTYYNGGTRTRKWQKVTITILEARTGNPLYSNSFLGNNPDACPPEIFELDHKDIIGPEVEYKQIEDWLLKYLRN